MYNYLASCIIVLSSDLEDLLTTLSLAQNKLGSPQDREDLNFMQQFFHNSDVQHAVGIQHTVGQLQLSKSPPLPVAANSETLAVEVIRPVQEVIYLHVLMMKKV